ncbi:hypothetical protein D9Q98_002585 [Chlorella vulgaris]|uniref:DNA helicase Pif1-like 2B domain-containing protein n=1 Tax=Chlorella vulgaris TaxID=3077 RepID=A0A9D4YYZ5_CHLVU|nr:hypothetical protein D9Q98_002585 [Chlorella vulgaris]
MRVEMLRSSNPAAAAHLAAFATFLLDMGEGKLHSHPGSDYVAIPSALLLPGLQQPSHLIQTVFGDLQQYRGDGQDLVDRAVLTPLNDDVDSLNNVCMSMFPGEERIYNSVDSVKDPGNATTYPVEFLHSLTPAGIPPHKLRLKPGAPIMLLRNINAAAGLANGTRLVVEQLSDRVIVAKIDTGSRTGQSVFIFRFNMAPSDVDLPFQLQRRHMLGTSWPTVS